MIQLCLATHVLCKVLDQTNMADLWLRLEALYRTKSLANKIGLKVCWYTFSMVEGTPI